MTRDGENARSGPRGRDKATDTASLAPSRANRRAGGNQSDAHSALVKSVTDYIWARGGWLYKVWGGPFGRRGIPDCLAVLRGRMIAIECKTGAAKLDKDQQYERARLERAGALYLEVRCPEDLERALLDAGLVDYPALTASMRFTPEEVP